MWVARDKDKTLRFFPNEKPQRKNNFYWSAGLFGDRVINDFSLFPELTWDNEPIEVELTKIHNRSDN